jgi:hypothetical protein
MTEKTAWAVLCVVGLLTRFPFLHWFTSELTDGVLCLTYFQSHIYEIPRFVIFPGYPALVSMGAGLGLPAETWGRTLSVLFGLWAMVPIWRLARRWASVEISFLVCLAYLLSPLVWMWSLRAMPETFFLFLFWYAVERAVSIEESPDLKKVSILSVCALSAFLVRPEGTLLVLFAVLILWRTRKYRVGGFILLLFTTALGFLPSMRFLFSHMMGAFEEGTVGVETPYVHMMGNLWVYLTQPAWVFSPILFFLAVGGVFSSLGGTDAADRFWRRRLSALLGIILLLKMVPTNYQDRHLLLFLPAVCVLAGLKLQKMEDAWRLRCSENGLLMRRNGLAALMLGFLAVFSTAVLVLQKDAFGDVSRNAQYLKTLPSNAVVYSDEQIKTEYVSKRPIHVWSSETRNLNPGDFLVFHTFNTPRLWWLEQTLTRHFEMELVHQDTSYVVPLLTDLMMDPQFQNRAQATARRFETQYFETKIYRIVRYIPRPKKEGWD